MTLSGFPRSEAVWWTTTVAMLALFALTVAVALLDRRLLNGANVWAKPLKFELSLALHFATLALVASALSEAWRRSPWLEAVAWASAACALFEIAYIALQAARQQGSHFNVSTPLYAALYSAMAVGAVVITAAAAVLGVVVAVDGQARFDPATRWGVVLGLVGGAVLTLVTAFRIGATMSPHVGIEPPGARRLPLTGWSLVVGDRRAAHFFATHMMQALPLAGLLLDRLLPRIPALIVLLGVAAAWTALTFFLFRQADAGLPLFSRRA
jgi:hypothetical protein